MNEILNQSDLKDKLNFIQIDIIKVAMKNTGKIFRANEIAVEYDIAINTARTYLSKLLEYPYKEGRTNAYIALANLQELLKR